MELKHLRYFVAAVEEGSLQRAAQRMHVAQPALSRRIRDLEAEIACTLLVRNPQGVVPTLAGADLYREALSILDRLDLASRHARRLGINQGRQVRLGLVQTSRKYGFVQRGIAAFAASAPSIGVEMVRAASHDLAIELREGRLDLTLLYERRPAAQGFGERLVHTERYVLAVHPSHPLAEAAPVALARLSGEPLVWLARRDDVDHHDRLLQQCRLHGFEPAIARMARSHEEQIDLVVAAGGLCLTPASTMLTLPEDMLLFRPLPALEMELHLSLAWSLDLAEGAMGGVLDALEDAIDRHQGKIAAGTAPCSRLYGHQVLLVERAASPQEMIDGP